MKATTIKKISAEDPEAKSADIVSENIEQLRVIFPEAITEGRVNFDVLKQLLGSTIDERDEKYGLNWHGKRRARQLALSPSTGTLRPCPEESVQWDTTQNLMIEGDNLEVLKLLQKPYAGRVKLIYIDPPYNTGKDFIYKDDYQDNIKNYLMLTGQIDSDGRKISSNTESSGRFHTDWLNMMYPRLRLARNLLRDDGVLFVSIDDTELSNLRTLLSEVFGEENFRANISWQKRYTRSNNTVDFTTMVEHLLVYSKSDSFVVNLLERTQEADARYLNPDNDERGPWKGASFLNPATPQQRPNLSYPLTNPNTGQITQPSTNAWRRSRDEFARLQAERRLYWGADGKQPVPSIKMFLSEARDITPVNFWDHKFAGNTDDGTKELNDLFGVKVFDNPKPVQLLRRVLDHASEPDSIVLDFFAGSGTTGHAVMEQNSADGGRRRYILVQLPEPVDSGSGPQHAGAKYCDKLSRPRNIAELTKQRLRLAGSALREANPMFAGDLGFRVLKLSSSNIREWVPDPADLPGTLAESTEHIRADRTEPDILQEVILKLGLDLCVPLQTRAVAGKEIYAVGGGVLMVCLASRIAHDEVESLAMSVVEWHKALSPIGDTVCIFRDSAFADDVAKTNLGSILEQNGLQIVRCL